MDGIKDGQTDGRTHTRTDEGCFYSSPPPTSGDKNRAALFLKLKLPTLITYLLVFKNHCHLLWVWVCICVCVEVG